MSASALEVGCLGTPSYGRVLIGKPSTYIAGAPPEGIFLVRGNNTHGLRNTIDNQIN